MTTTPDFDAWRAGVLGRIDEMVELLRQDDGTWFGSDLVGLGEIVHEALTELEAAQGDEDPMTDPESGTTASAEDR
jgi:hypothetical protein